VRLDLTHGVAALLLGLAGGCATTPAPTWQRPDVSAASARQVELECRQRAITAIDAGRNPAEIQRVHTEREQYFARCMRGSGFELR
jgi:hypothetical protein